MEQQKELKACSESGPLSLLFGYVFFCLYFICACTFNGSFKSMHKSKGKLHLKLYEKCVRSVRLQ